jgi:hypothetical protein
LDFAKASFAGLPVVIHWAPPSQKKSNRLRQMDFFFLVIPSGAISNYILEDLEAISNVIRSGVLD